MANLITIATGNFTAAGSWGVVDATSLLDSEAGNTALTTSYVTSSTFTPGAITIDGIAVKLASVAASPTGTITVALDQGGADVAGTIVTINVSDLPSCSTTQNEGGWILFKFAAPVLLLAATAYSVKAKTSSASQVNLYRDATAGNWSRQLRTTTTQAPAAGDVLHCIGEKTGAGTGNNFVVTMDNTATTQFGSGTDASVAMTIGSGCQVSYGIMAATNYYLKLGGNLILYNGGRFDIGNNGSEIPRDSTAILEFNVVANLGKGFFIRNGAVFNSYGLSRTAGKNVISAKLTSTIVSGNTTLNLDTDTGWLNGDLIVVAKTTVGSGRDDETLTLNANASASSLTVAVAPTLTHLGVDPYAAHVVLKTRNIIIRTTNSTLMVQMTIAPTSIVTMRWSRLQYVQGTSSTTGVLVNTTTGSCDIQYCTFSDTLQSMLTISSSTNNITFAFNLFHNFNSNPVQGAKGIAFGSTLGANVIFTDNFIIRFGFSGGGTTQGEVHFDYLTFNFSRNVINSGGLGVQVRFNSTTPFGTFDDNIIYGLYGSADTAPYSGAISIGAPINGGTINRLIMFHNAFTGFNVTNVMSNVTFNNCIIYGNSGQNLRISAGGTILGCTFNNLQLNGDNIQSSPTGILLESGGVIVSTKFNNCSFGMVSGNYIAHTQDIQVTGGYADTVLYNSNFGSSTLVATQSNLDAAATIKFDKYQATSNNHLWYTKYGIFRSTGTGLADTNVRTSGSLGLRIAAIDLTTGGSWSFKILAKANTAVSVIGFIQKNAAFGTDIAKVDLYLPGSTTPDATQTMPNDTNWNPFALAASYTGTVDLYATVNITAKTTTANAYIYIDDLYNGTNKITALDTWDQGQPSPIMFEQLGDAGAVWAVLTSTMSATGSIGARLKKALTVPLFLGLK